MDNVRRLEGRTTGKELVDFHASAAGPCVKQDGVGIVTGGWSERQPANRRSLATH